MQALNFPITPNFDITSRDGREMILDTLRQKYVVLTPEEWVRQNFVRYLIEGLGFPQGRTAIETGFVFQGMQCRADVLVYDRHGKALLMGE
ncbi:MAG: type I restriction enzyme HsdR N-terminal domain-containing protein, partial [Candidatus Latescibacteria bacterium]|nr:type I restriction enzyme HsdR N-terminal domain-containing protein [Candidatus Latescibacterota bacterium]